jgi:hypothetical protein
LNGKEKETQIFIPRQQMAETATDRNQAITKNLFSGNFSESVIFFYRSQMVMLPLMIYYFQENYTLTISSDLILKYT